MGLDITAYRGLKEVRPRNKEVDDDGYRDDQQDAHDRGSGDDALHQRSSLSGPWARAAVMH